MWSVVQYHSIGKDIRRKPQVEKSKQKSFVDSANGYEGRSQSNSQLVEAPTESGDTSHNHQQSSDPNNGNSRIKVGVTDFGDPFNPKNWSLLSRSKNIAILALLITVQAWAGAAESIANSNASQQFGVSKVAENLSTAMYLFGVGSGCLFVGPLSETVGRNPTYLVSTFCYLFFVLGSALTKTFGGQIVCRYLIGVFSSATLGINGASVRDQFRPVKRAFVFPVIAWANVVPPTIAPIVGGWILENPNLTWRWTQWVTLIISCFAFIIALLFLPETYLPVLLDWKAKHLRQVTGQPYFSEHAEKASYFRRIKEVLPLPINMFLKEPVVTVLGSYLILLYILLFTFLSGFDYIFKQTYNLSSGQTGSCFGSIAAGATFFTLFAPGLYSWARYRTGFKTGAHLKPEFRLWPAMAAAPLLPISLFWLGWTNYPTISIWSGLGACFVFGIVLIAIYVSSYEYIIDSYGDHAAIALASITMVRYLIAGGMTMAARPMYEGIGVHWTMTLLGCFATLLVPGPFLLHKYGHRLREKSLYAKSEVGVSDDK
ncbi:hypothetical protein TWF694_010354 [Orbilia ellipsospora]|uniref:Major facilitator superfamily (MFS) profile domain-containing protein n=1 Tax=Orbilia ellipsospora TaxID=2528407 RepID=A0AAV9X9N3_9PEZI